MRSKVILLAARYMLKFLLAVSAFMISIYTIVNIVRYFTNDTELGFIICFASLGLIGAFITCYDMAKNKIDDENRDLMRELSRYRDD